MKTTIDSMIEDIHIVKTELDYLYLRGWAFDSDGIDKNYSLILKIGEKEIFDKPFNVCRKDVAEHFKKTSDKYVFGFEYKIHINNYSTNENIEVFIKTGERFNLIAEFQLNKLDIINDAIECHIESITAEYKDKQRSINIKGWAYSKASKEPVKMIIRSRKKKVIKICDANEERYDVKKAFKNHEITGLCGFNHNLLLSEGVRQISISFTDNKRNTKTVENIDIGSIPATGEAPRKLLCIFKNKLRYCKYRLSFIKNICIKAWSIIWHKHKLKISMADIRMYYLKAKMQLEDNRKNFESIDSVKDGYEFVPKIDLYQAWIKNNTLSQNVINKLKEAEVKFKYRPLISIVMPVYNVKEIWLEKAVGSIMNQIYSNWELCIADDASTLPHIKHMLEKMEKRDNRIKAVYRTENGNISAATNSAAEIAAGEYILFMDNDDELAVNALYEIVKLLQDNPNADIIYTDDDKIDEDGNRYAPQFKPDWSPELLLSYMYLSHIFCIRTSLFWQIGGLRAGFEGAQDYDMALRATEKTHNIYHIPKVLYHWRAVKGSTAQSGLSKPEAFERGIKAVEQALKRRKINAGVSRPDFAIKGNLGIFNLTWPDYGPKVTIIIPTKNQYKLLKRCIESIKKTTYKNYDVVIVDNGSDEQETLDYLSKQPHRVERIPNKAGSFSYAYINNEAVKRIDSEYILFLNNDTEVINPQWLSAMVGYCGIEGVGAAGARLIFPDNRIQHAGIVIGLYRGMAGPAFKLIPEWDPGYLAYSKAARNYSAVTAACLLIKKEEFIGLNGFDEENFAVAYNDVDLCLRLREKGKRIVYVPEAELRHYEGATRGFNDNINELIAFSLKYKGYQDPYYNINLSKENEKFEIAPDCTNNYANELNIKPKMLMAGFNLNLEGAPFSQYELTLGLLNGDRFDIEVYCPSEGPLKEFYEKEGIKVHVFQHPLNGVFDKEEYSKSMDQFASWIKENQFDLIYANTMQCFYIIDAAHRAGIPSIWNIRESASYNDYFNFLPNAIRGKGIEAFQYPYKIIFVADATKIMYKDLNYKNSFMVIYNGLKLETINQFKKNITKDRAKENILADLKKKIVLIVGTVCERKGQFDFVQAAIKYASSQKTDDVVFYIVGARQSAYLNKIINFIKTHQASKYIVLVPETKNVYEYYRAADVFVCSSYNESYPRVILEAMAFDLPIITTPVFGISEQVIENMNALFYEPGDIEQLAKNMEILLKNNELANTFSENSAKVLMLKNSYEEMVQAYEKEMISAWMTKQ